MYSHRGPESQSWPIISLSFRQSVIRVLQLYKDRFVASLPDADKASADFGRPVFLAVTFYLVARKNKVGEESVGGVDKPPVGLVSLLPRCIKIVS